MASVLLSPLRTGLREESLFELMFTDLRRLVAQYSTTVEARAWERSSLNSRDLCYNGEARLSGGNFTRTTGEYRVTVM